MNWHQHHQWVGTVGTGFERKKLTAKTEQDIQIAKSWTPGTIKEYKKGRIAMP